MTDSSASDSSANSSDDAAADGTAANGTEPDSSESAAVEPNAPETTAEDFPSSGVLLGIDYGTKRVGYAVCDATQFIASPLDNYTRRSEQLDGQHLQRLAQEYQVAGLVVGLPVHMSGDEGGKAFEARQYGTWASQLTGLPVMYHDERFTSSMAEMHLMNAGLSKKRRKARMDKVAAQILLQSFLDSPNRGAKPEAM